MSILNKLLLIILIFFISVFILTIPKIDQIPQPTQWDAAINYGREYIIENGFISPEINNVSWLSSLRNYGNQDILSKILYAEINLVTGIITFPNDIKFLDIFIFSKILLMPLFGIFAYSVFSNKKNNLNFLNIGLITFFSIFPLASSLPKQPGQGSAGNLISMALFILILLILIKKNNFRFSCIIIILYASFFLFWHTWSYYLLILFIILFLFSFFIKGQNWKFISILAIIFYITTGFYFNYYQLIYMPLSSISDFLKNRPNVSSLLNPTYFSNTTGNNIYSILQIINSILIAIIIIVTFIILFKKLIENKATKNEKLLLLFLFSLGFMFLALFITGGYGTLISRALEPSIPLSIISAAYILGNSNYHKKKDLIKKGFSIIIIIIILLCLSSYIIFSKDQEINLNEKEAVGINFCGLKTNSSQSFFSDFRLLPPLLRYDKKYLYLPYSEDYNKSINNDLLSIYYKENYNPSKIISKIVHGDSHITLVSHNQINNPLCLPIAVLRSPINTFINNFRLDKNYICYYSNGDLDLFFYKS